MSSRKKQTSEIVEYKSNFGNDSILLAEFTHPGTGELDIGKCRSILGSKYSDLSDDEILEIYNVTVAYANFIINLYFNSLCQKM